ncbi:hypothetical protein ACHAXT_000629 [Thalassiosira profunda]
MRPSTSLWSAAVLAAASPAAWAFQQGRAPAVAAPRLHPATSLSPTALGYSNWDAFETRDSMELLVGGARYEFVELPDSMMSTTLWVGNLCEFVTDEMLSDVFQQASSLKFVPACVARKPNMESMKYGFVTFRSEEEKETAMNLLHGYELQGKAIVVEPIKDHEKHGRIRAPQKIVDYAVGPIKRQRKGELNTMRRATATIDGDDGDRYKHERERRRARLARRKDRGRYKNQQRKNSRATAPWC